MTASSVTSTCPLLCLLLLLVIFSSSFGFQIISKCGCITPRSTSATSCAQPLRVQPVRLAASRRFHENGCDNDRRQAILTIVTTASTLGLFGNIANAEMLQLPASSTELPAGLLESRVQDNVMSPPQYGMESIDIFYPACVNPDQRNIERIDLLLNAHKNIVQLVCRYLEGCF